MKIKAKTNKIKKKNKAKLILLFFLLFFCCQKQKVYDIIIDNANIYDGSGKNHFLGAIAIEGKTIKKIWKNKEMKSKEIAKFYIDAKGMAVSPAFIDTHSHADFYIASTSGSIKASNLIFQGVGTAIIGNCGRSMFLDMENLKKEILKRKSTINFAALVGYNSILDALSKENLKNNRKSSIERILKKAMDEGALGISTGFAYSSAFSSSPDELIHSLEVVKELGGIHATHIRDEGIFVFDSIKEIVELSEKVGIPLIISHFKILQNNCQKYQEIKNFLLNKKNIFLDFYPYEQSKTNADIYLPDYFKKLGWKERKALLCSKRQREKLGIEIIKIIKENGFDDFSFMLIACYKPRKEWQGKTIREVAMEKYKNVELINQLEIFIEIISKGGAEFIYHNICPDVMKKIPEDFEAMVGCDSSIFEEDVECLMHPRSYGTFPKYINLFVVKERTLNLEEAIKRITYLPAKTFKLKKRGLIRSGYFADIIIFNPKNFNENILSKYPTGIHCLVINGKIVFKKEGKNIRIISFPGTFISKK
jgi:N-acyl-D-amino-acid deacylase